MFACAPHMQVQASAADVEVIQGDVVSEVRQVWPGLGALVTRLWKDQPGLEVEWAAGPPPSGTNWELFVRYSSTIKSGGCCCGRLRLYTASDTCYGIFLCKGVIR